MADGLDLIACCHDRALSFVYLLAFVLFTSDCFTEGHSSLAVHGKRLHLLSTQVSLDTCTRHTLAYRSQPRHQPHAFCPQLCLSIPPTMYYFVRQSFAMSYVSMTYAAAA